MNWIEVIITGLNLRQKRMLLELLDMHPAGGVRVKANTMYIDHMLDMELIHIVTGSTTELQVYKLTLSGHEVAKKLKGER